MKVAAYARVKNESDIIEVFCRQTLRYVDELFIEDNMSDDSTYLILTKLVEEGLPIRLRRDPDRAHKQGPKTTAALREIAVADPNISAVFFLDGDELLSGDIDSWKEYVTPGVAYRIKRYRYIWWDSRSSSLSVPDRLTLRREKPETHKSVLLLDDSRARYARVGHGSHYVYRRGAGRVNKEFLPDIWISHYPVRSKDQYISKVVMGWMSLLLENPNYLSSEKPLGSHWKRGFELVMRNNFCFSDDDFVRLIGEEMGYSLGDAVDLPLATPELRYESLIDHTHIAKKLAESQVSLIRRYWAQVERTIPGEHVTVDNSLPSGELSWF